MKNVLRLAAAGWLAVAGGFSPGGARAGLWDRPDLLNLGWTYSPSWFTDVRDYSNWMWAIAGSGDGNSAGGGVSAWDGYFTGARIWWNLDNPDKVQRAGTKFTAYQKSYVEVGAVVWTYVDSSWDTARPEGCKGLVKVAGTPPNDPTLGKWAARCGEDVLDLLEMVPAAEELIRELFAGENLRAVKGKGPPQGGAGD